VHNYFVYIMASQRNGTLYIGVTNNLGRRVYDHKTGTFDGFTKRYGVIMLVYYELHSDIKAAIKREKQMKKWNRQWKINKIVEQNPDWDDLYETIV
jgi:putative endonuclease